MFDERRQVQRLAVLEFGEHAHPLAEQRVGHGHGGGDRHGGMGGHHLLDLDRADVLAAADDEVRRPAGQPQVAVGVQLADVAHPHPAVLGVQLVVVGAAQVAHAQRRPAANRLSAAGIRDVLVAVEQPHLHLGDDPPGGPQPVVPRVPGGGGAEHPGFVGAVELQDRHPGELFELSRLGVGQRLTAGEDHAQAGQVVLPRRVAGQDHHQLGAHAAQHRRTVALDGRAGRCRVEAFDEHRRGAQVDRCGVRGPDAEAERCGNDRQEDVVGGELAVGDRLLVEVVPAVLGVDDALGQAGGARRGVDQERVVGPEGRQRARARSGVEVQIAGLVEDHRAQGGVSFGGGGGRLGAACGVADE